MEVFDIFLLEAVLNGILLGGLAAAILAWNNGLAQRINELIQQLLNG